MTVCDDEVYDGLHVAIFRVLERTLVGGNVTVWHDVCWCVPVAVREDGGSCCADIFGCPRAALRWVLHPLDGHNIVVKHVAHSKSSDSLRLVKILDPGNADAHKEYVKTTKVGKADLHKKKGAATLSSTTVIKKYKYGERRGTV